MRARTLRPPITAWITTSPSSFRTHNATSAIFWGLRNIPRSASLGSSSTIHAERRKPRDWKSDEEYTKLTLAKANARFSGKDRSAVYAESFRAPMTLADKQAERLLSQSHRAVEVLRQYIKNGQVTSHVVRLCLEAQYNEQALIPRRHRSAIHKLQREDGLARLIIMHILKDFDNWTAFLHRERNAIDSLCYFATIEGLEDTLLKWLEVPTTDNDNLWRANLLVGICKAPDLLDTRESADAGLEPFFQGHGHAQYQTSRARWSSKRW